MNDEYFRRGELAGGLIAGLLAVVLAVVAAVNAFHGRDDNPALWAILGGLAIAERVISIIRRNV